MGAGDAPRSDVERSQAGPPIGSGRGPTRIEGAAEARAVDTPAERRPVDRGRQRAPPGGASAPACSGRRPAGPPFGPS
jgi:hypothetical protein